MREKGDGEVHGAADVDVDFLVCFFEVEVVDVQWSLHAGIVDYAIDVWMVGEYFLDKGRKGRGIAGVEDIVGSTVA